MNGSEKQIKWANDIKQALAPKFDEAKDQLSKIENVELRDAALSALDSLLNEESAGTWIKRGDKWGRIVPIAERALEALIGTEFEGQLDNAFEQINK